MRTSCKELTKLEKRLKNGDLYAGFKIGEYLIRNEYAHFTNRIIKLLEKAALEGFYQAALSLGLFYEEEWNPKKSYQLAFKWFKFAAENGVIEACNQVAVYLEGGVYVRKDLKAAMLWYKKGARLGDVIAQANLARNFEEGIGTKKNLASALKWYETSMLQGFEEIEEDYHRIRELIKKMG